MVLYRNPQQREKIPKPFKKRNWTQEELEEYTKCSQDIIYFTFLCTIVTLDKGRIKIRLRDYQQEMLQKFVRYNKNVVLATRQCGKTTSLSILALWYSLFHLDYYVGILSNVGDNAISVIDDIKVMFEDLPDFLKMGVDTYNKKSIEFENGSKIISRTTTKNSFRGESINLLILDEFAFVDTNIADRFWKSCYPTITSSKTGKVIITSTINGVNKFYQLYSDGCNERNEFVASRINWWQVPGRDEAWKARVIADIGETAFNQEYACQLIGSQYTLIDAKTLKNLTIKRPLITENIPNINEVTKYYQHSLHIYRKPEEMGLYVIGVDTGEGVGQDYSVCQVIDCIKKKQVAVFRDNTIDIDSFARLTYNLAQYYNNAYVIAEANSIAQRLIGILFKDLEYENMFVDTKRRQPGIYANKATKREAVLLLKKYIQEKILTVVDENTIKEIMTYVKKKKSWEAESGMHDDTVTAFYWAVWMLNNENFQDTIDSYKEEIPYTDDNNEDEYGSMPDPTMFGIDPIEIEKKNFERELIESELPQREMPKHRKRKKYRV